MARTGKLPRYSQLHHGTYRYIRDLPDDVAAIVGRKNYIKSYNTGCLRTVEKEQHRYNVMFDDFVEQTRNPSPLLAVQKRHPGMSLNELPDFMTPEEYDRAFARPVQIYERHGISASEFFSNKGIVTPKLAPASHPPPPSRLHRHPQR